MPRNALDADFLSEALGQLMQVGEGGPNVAEKVRLVRMIREHSAGASEQLDTFLLEQTAALKTGVLQAEAKQRELRALLETMAEPPWYPAIYFGATDDGRDGAAVVCVEGNRRVVNVAGDVELASVARGDEVYLNGERNLVVGTSSRVPFSSGETAQFDRSLGDGRLVLRSRDEEIVVDGASRLGTDELRNGDLVRWDRSAWMAFERLQPSEGRHLFLEDTPSQTFSEIGGLDEQIEELQELILLRFLHRQTAERYSLQALRSVLLVGRPGNGKTMVARALANWLANIVESGRSRFINVKPGGLHSMWYGQTEANYREVFRVAREAARAEPRVPVVMFFDEVDALGAARGESHVRVDDRVLTAFMTELDGLEDRGNILVVAATNRPEALDDALLRPGRLGDKKIDIARPNRDAARQILGCHLPEGIPYADATNGGEQAIRGELIDAAVARVYTPNGYGELARLTFRDGRTRSVESRDLVSGAVLAQIARQAVLSACTREMNTGEPGLRLSDLLEAIDGAFRSAANVLTPANCHRHVDDLPQDVDVVKLEPVERRVHRAHRFLQVV